MNSQIIILHYASHAAYLYVGLFLVLGTLGLPFPEEIILLIAGYLAGTGVVIFWRMMLFTLVIMELADNGMYYLSRRLGREIVTKWGKYFFIPATRLKKLEEYFQKHGDKTVFFSRLLIGFRSTGIIMAGITGMPWKKFVIWNSLSIAVYLPIILGLGYLFHLNLSLIFSRFALIKHFIFTLVVIAIFVWFLKKAFTNGQRT